MGSVVNKACDLAKPAAALAVIALLWRQVHPTSYQLGQAILVAVNLSAGYNETKRQAATGRIASGEHLLHKFRQQLVFFLLLLANLEADRELLLSGQQALLSLSDLFLHIPSFPSG